MTINWEIEDTLILLNVSGTPLDIMVETLKPIKDVINVSVEKAKRRNPQFNLAIDRVYIDAKAQVFEHVIDYLRDQLVVPSNSDDRLRLRNWPIRTALTIWWSSSTKVNIRCFLFIKKIIENNLLILFY